MKVHGCIPFYSYWKVWFSNLFLNVFSGDDDTDFERGMGMWKNVGQIQWRRNTYFTQTMETGPSADHTTGTGIF